MVLHWMNRLLICLNISRLNKSRLSILLACFIGVGINTATAAEDGDQWFRNFKQEASPQELYTFLYAMPKGGDLHHHLSGSNFSEWWLELATDQEVNGGYQYFTKVAINNCLAYENANFGSPGYLLLFKNIQLSEYEQLSACEKSEYLRLEELSDAQKLAWLNSIRLDKATEGRNEFFETHWQRLNDLAANPYISAEMLFRNMQSIAAEGMVYLETIETAHTYKHPDGKPFTSDEVADIYRQRLKQADARATGVTVRMQDFVLRFLPSAEQDLERSFQFVDQNRDLYVAINMVGREDNDAGHPLRFLPTMRKMRRTISGVNLSIHGGEVDEPNQHVRDTLLLGAKRIGHGINLIDDPDTLLLLREGKVLIEINLISNLLLNYFSDYKDHPFPEYLRTGVPVALSTDDRGMWDSNVTDEFFVAVNEYNLSWQEIVMLGENSLRFAFVEDNIKKDLVENYHKRLKKFVKRFRSQGMKSLADVQAKSYSFTCKRYQVCFD